MVHLFLDDYSDVSTWKIIYPSVWWCDLLELAQIGFPLELISGNKLMMLENKCQGDL